MSARPAKVSVGLAKQTTAETRNSAAEERPRPTHRHVERRQGDVLDAGAQEHEPDEDADRGHGRLVELQDDQRDGHPGDPGDEQHPPVAGEPARAVAQGPNAGHFELRCSGMSAHDDLRGVVVVATDPRGYVGELSSRVLRDQGVAAAGPQAAKPPANAGLSLCAEEDSNLHPVIPDQALNLVTRVSYPSDASIASRTSGILDAYGRIGRSGCCHGCCHGDAGRRGQRGAWDRSPSGRHADYDSAVLWLYGWV